MSLMLETEEVDEEYFTPVASTTLASIFKADLNKDLAVNPSLRYRPPPLKKPVLTSKSEDSTTTLCLYSCSVIAYEWVQGSHTCKGKVGFAMMRNGKTGICKIILYSPSPEKTTLSCITIVPQLEVTLAGTMISLYDDLKKYWSLCFNDKIIEQVKDLFKSEKVILKNPDSEKHEPDIEKTANVDSNEVTDETDYNIMAEQNMSPSRNDKISILNRIANVGHAILPSLPDSPVTKTVSIDVFSNPEKPKSIDGLNVSLDGYSNKLSCSNMSAQDQAGHNTSTKCQEPPNIAIKGEQNANITSGPLLNSSVQNAHTSVTSVPLVNNQLFTYVNGFMVPLQMQVPIMNNITHTDASAELDQVIQKLTNLQGVVRTMEMMNKFQNKDEEPHACTCKSQKLIDDTTIQNLKDENKKLLKRISELEESIREKDLSYNKLKLETKAQNEITNDSTKTELQQITEKSNQEVNTKNIKLHDMISKEEADSHLANAIKNLMNDTFRSLTSNFQDEISYNGNNVKAVLAAVIKNNTLESLGVLLGKRNSSNTTKIPE